MRTTKAQISLRIRDQAHIKECWGKDCTELLISLLSVLKWSEILLGQKLLDTEKRICKYMYLLNKKYFCSAVKTVFTESVVAKGHLKSP